MGSASKTRKKPSATAKRRESFDYRKAYLKHNPGVCGYYTCAYCRKRISEKNMEVDHIIPLNKFGINRTINCVAACRRCNRHKSDNVNGMIIVGLVSKVLEEVKLTFRGSLGFGFRMIANILALPYRVSHSLLWKTLITLGYAIIVYSLIRRW